MWSKPCSRKSAASAASRSAASTLRFCASRSSSSAGIPLARSMSRRPSPSSAPTTAQLARETTCERILASRPSEKSGKRSKSARAVASSSTLSPRNSSRSYDDARSGAQDECVKTFSRRSAGSVSIKRPSSALPAAEPLLARRDVVDSLPDRLDLLRVLVRDLDPELVLELHDQLDQIERVRIEIFLERRFLGDLVLVDAELFAQHLSDPLVDFLARRCHVTSLAVSFSGTRDANSGCGAVARCCDLRCGGRQRFDVAAAVGLAVRADVVRPLRLVAHGALVDARRLETVRRAAAVAPGAGLSSLRNG